MKLIRKIAVGLALVWAGITLQAASVTFQWDDTVNPPTLAPGGNYRIDFVPLAGNPAAAFSVAAGNMVAGTTTYSKLATVPSGGWGVTCVARTVDGLTSDPSNSIIVRIPVAPINLRFSVSLSATKPYGPPVVTPLPIDDKLEAQVADPKTPKVATK